MQTTEFIGQVRKEGALEDRREAVRATQAVLHVLNVRLGSEADHLRSQLPKQLKTMFHESRAERNRRSLLSGPQRFNYEGFIERVADEAELDHDTAEQATRTVFGILKHQISHGEAEHVAAQLPADIERVWRGA